MNNKGMNMDKLFQNLLRGGNMLEKVVESSDSDDEGQRQHGVVLVYQHGAANRRPTAPSQTERVRLPWPKNSKLCVHIANTSLTLISGNLAEQNVEVIVNNASSDLDLSKGAGSKALLKAGGPEIQHNCRDNYPSGLSINEVAVSTGGALNCTKVYHVTIPRWNNDNEEEIKKAFTNCLILAEQYNVKSLAVSPLGHGFLGYPDDVIARTMIAAVVKIGPMAKHSGSIYIVCHRSQHSIFKALETEMKQLTVQIHMDMYNGDLISPSYWTHYTHDKTLREWNCHLLTNTCWEQVPVSPDERSAIEQLVQRTWMKQYVGHGRDAKGLTSLNYNKMVVVDIQRIENSILAEKYCQQRATLFHKVGKLERPFTKLVDIPYTKRGHIFTSPQQRDETLSRDMYPMVNEHYLFHGTTADKIDVIAAQGFDNRLTQNAMFGPGTYAAESPTKSDQYSDPRDQRDKRTPKKMILTRMLLGEMFVTSEAKSFQRPPCKTCMSDKCCNSSHNVRGQGFFDSVVVDGQWNFREFIVYNSSQCYPEYIITYKRT